MAKTPRTEAGRRLDDDTFVWTPRRGRERLTLTERILAIEAEAQDTAASSGLPEIGRWARRGWHDLACWRAWVEANGEAECVCVVAA